MATHYLEPKSYQYTFGPHEPALAIHSGDTVIAPTRDARGYGADGGELPESMKPRREDTAFCPSNPLVGPLYVEDAAVGDAVAVSIERIALNRPSAWSRKNPHFGFFTGEGPGKWMLLNEPLKEARYDWTLDIEQGIGTLELSKSRLKQITIPLHPFLGSIGVAPRFGRVETALTPGEYGGNMDCVETREGTILYLPVWVRGGYLSFGDVHAAQGDGEICGVALETTAFVTLRIDVLKDRCPHGARDDDEPWAMCWPRMEDNTHIMAVGNARPLMDAVKIAHVELLKWLVNGYGFDRWEAFQVLSQVGTMRVGNIVDPNYTVVAKFPKAYLP